MEDLRNDIGFIVSEDCIRDEKTKVVKGLSFQEVTETAILIDLDRNEWKIVESIRRISQDGLVVKIVEMFKNGSSIYQKETSTVNERNQFDRLWSDNWK